MKVQIVYTDPTLTPVLQTLFDGGKVTTKSTTKSTYYILTAYTYDIELIIECENRQLAVQIYVDGGRVY